MSFEKLIVHNPDRGMESFNRELVQAIADQMLEVPGSGRLSDLWVVIGPDEYLIDPVRILSLLPGTWFSPHNGRENDVNPAALRVMQRYVELSHKQGFRVYDVDRQFDRRRTENIGRMNQDYANGLAWHFCCAAALQIRVCALIPPPTHVDMLAKT